MLQQAIITKHCNQNVKVTESKHEVEHLKTHTCVHVHKKVIMVFWDVTVIV